MTPTKARPVTGPDGDNPITDEQIRELAEGHDDIRVRRAALVAENESGARADAARERCAAAWNARQGGAR